MYGFYYIRWRKKTRCPVINQSIIINSLDKAGEGFSKVQKTKNEHNLMDEFSDFEQINSLHKGIRPHCRERDEFVGSRPKKVRQGTKDWRKVHQTSGHC